jgi:uncharacterized protein YcnI
MEPRRSVISRAVLVAVAGIALVLLTAGPASAHVHVDGVDVAQGGYGVLTFRVPTESATASTTKVSVAFPADTPIASVSTQPLPGWTATVRTAKLSKPVTTDDGSVDTYVSSVTWTADSRADAIAPGEFQQFSVSAGPLPKVSELVLPTTQTYSDGTVVNWNERSADAAAEPAHPAPVLALSAATDAPVAATAHQNGPAAWPGWVGLGAGCAALVVAAAAFARTGRPKRQP